MQPEETRKDIEKAIGGRLYASALTGPIDDLGRIERSLLLGELANIVYLQEELAARAARILGFTSHLYFDRGGAQAFLFTTDDDSVLICRGTEASDWNDIKADVNVTAVVAETIGHVHGGFKQEVDDIWPDLEPVLATLSNRLWIGGHSLGGAMATIIASRCKIKHFQTKPIEVYTYGSPRVGDKAYVGHAQVVHIRWVNNNDIITRMPPKWLNYEHTGTEMYINHYGNVRRMTRWQRSKDRWRGFWSSLIGGDFDVLSDHLMDNYITHINGLSRSRHTQHDTTSRYR